jgi:hypothetical protein
MNDYRAFGGMVIDKEAEILGERNAFSPECIHGFCVAVNSKRLFS